MEWCRGSIGAGWKLFHGENNPRTAFPLPQSAELRAGGDLGSKKVEFENEMGGKFSQARAASQSFFSVWNRWSEMLSESWVRRTHVSKVELNTNTAVQRQAAEGAPPVGSVHRAR